MDAALGARLTTLAGEETTAAELREIADLFQSGLGATLTFHCRILRDAPAAQPHLIEVRQCVDNDGPRARPRTPLDCAAVKRRDQGCGQHFRIAGMRAMSFSPQMRELFIAYGLTAVAMLIGLLLMRADRRAYFRWPVYSVMVMALGVVLWNLLRKHLLPASGPSRMPARCITLRSRSTSQWDWALGSCWDA